MGENTNIAWATHTFNPWIGCQHVSPGCDFCYAEDLMDHRYHKVEWGPHGERRRTSAANWKLPLKWAKDAKASGTRPRVFCASLADVFDNRVPKEWRRDLFHLIWETPELDWLLLTKRPENIKAMLPFAIGECELWPWKNVWLGVTCEDQERAEHRIPILLGIPATVRFLSCEPLLGPLDLDHFLRAGSHRYAGSIMAGSLQLVIVGGESGKNARPMDLDWAHSLVLQCEKAQVPCFMKQLGTKPVWRGDRVIVRDSKGGDPAEWPNELIVRRMPGGFNAYSGGERI